MRLFVRVLITLTALSFMQSLVFAGSLTVTSSGVFNDGVITTTWSAANTSWFFSFDVADTPAVTNVESDPDLAFDITDAVSNFTYMLNGAPVVTIPARIRFFTLGFGGLFDLNLIDTVSPPDGNPDTGFVFSDSSLDGQAFSGATAAPTILPGFYTATTNSAFYSGGTSMQDLTGTMVNITSGADSPGVPEPSTFVMAAAACCLFGWKWRGQNASK